MSMQPAQDARLNFDLADRLRRALRVSEMTNADMAEALEVSPNTISNWINGRSVPRRRDLNAFALRTGFPRDWLETGAGVDERDGGPDGGGGVNLPSTD